MDPYSDKPLVYRRTAGGFTLYSFGADFDDDGGLHSNWDDSRQGGDHVFRPVETAQQEKERLQRERKPPRRRRSSRRYRLR